MVISTGLKILYSFLYMKYINYIHLLNFLLLPSLSYMWPPFRVTCFSSYCLYFYLVYIPCIRENMQFLAFWTWLTLLKMIISLTWHCVWYFLLSYWHQSFAIIYVWDCIFGFLFVYSYSTQSRSKNQHKSLALYSLLFR
jgi:hypothetical protein